MSLVHFIIRLIAIMSTVYRRFDVTAKLQGCVLSQELYFFLVCTYFLPGTIFLFITKWLLPIFTQELYFSKRIGYWRIFSMYPVLSCQYCQLQFLKGPLNFASNNDLEKNNIHAKNAIGFFMME